MPFPPKITIPSDSTELELIEVTGKGEKTGKYLYLNGYYHKGKLISWSEKDFEKAVKRNIIKIK